jgi:hypothetical protein
MDKSFKEDTRFDAEVRLRNSHGEYEWFLVRAIPYKDESGKTATWFGSCTNIHRQKEDRLQVGQMLSKKERALKDIAFDQAHLIRMPLSNVLGLLQLMERWRWMKRCGAFMNCCCKALQNWTM